MLRRKGINYQITKSNVDPETCIRQGVISQHSIMAEALGDFSFDYGKPHCPKCGEKASADDVGQYDFFCNKCNYRYRAEDAYPDQSLAFQCDLDGYFLANRLDNHILVLRSKFHTYAAPVC